MLVFVVGVVTVRAVVIADELVFVVDAMTVELSAVELSESAESATTVVVTSVAGVVSAVLVAVETSAVVASLAVSEVVSSLGCSSSRVATGVVDCFTERLGRYRCHAFPSCSL